MVKCDFQTNIFLMTDQQVAYKALHSDCHLAVAPNKSTFPWLKLWAPYDTGFNSESHESCSLFVNFRYTKSSKLNTQNARDRRIYSWPNTKAIRSKKQSNYDVS